MIVEHLKYLLCETMAFFSWLPHILLFLFHVSLDGVCVCLCARDIHFKFRSFRCCLCVAYYVPGAFYSYSNYSFILSFSSCWCCCVDDDISLLVAHGSWLMAPSLISFFVQYLSSLFRSCMVASTMTRTRKTWDNFQFIYRFFFLFSSSSSSSSLSSSSLSSYYSWLFRTKIVVFRNVHTLHTLTCTEHTRT